MPDQYKDANEVLQGKGPHKSIQELVCANWISKAMDLKTAVGGFK